MVKLLNRHYNINKMIFFRLFIMIKNYIFNEILFNLNNLIRFNYLFFWLFLYFKTKNKLKYYQLNLLIIN